MNQNKDNNNIETTNLNSVSLYFRDISEKRVLERDEEIELFKRIKEGDKDAKNIVIECNLKFVVKIAKEYVGCGIPFQDLIQEGNIGLMIAIDKYEYSYGYRFTTYAEYWIRQRINLGISNTLRNIRIPFYFFEKIGIYNKTCSELKTKYGRTPTIEEIAKKMDVSIKFIKQIERHLADTYSINELVGEKKDVEFSNFIITDENFVNDVIIKKELKKEVKELFKNSSLNEKELNIIMLRYGFYDGKAYKLEEIAELYGVSRQAISQLEQRIFNKLLKTKGIDKLAEYTKDKEQALENINNVLTDSTNTKNGKLYLKTIFNYYNMLIINEDNNRDEFVDNKVKKIFYSIGLNPLEVEIILYRNKFNGRNKLSYKELGQIFNITTLEANNIYMDAVKKIGASNILPLVNNYKKILDNWKKEFKIKEKKLKKNN